uniref:Protein kinase domain-containing protein n=1 Tax=Astyanax mexicanus TaxID=7994 RepID=A0A3B1IP35_ASTMX
VESGTVEAPFPFSPYETLEIIGPAVVRDLGEGAFGTVKLPTYEKHPNMVAIKIIDKDQELAKICFFFFRFSANWNIYTRMI